MSDNKETPFEIKCNILADLWMNYRGDIDFKDFIEYNDVGLPAAWLLAEDIVSVTERVTPMIEETFLLLMAALDIEEDSGFESLDDMLVG
jgi:hypothetical protein